MNTDKNQLQRAMELTERMRRARNAMRDFWGELFPAKMLEYQTIIKSASDRYQVDTFAATLRLTEDLQKKFPEAARTQVMLLAAYVEMVEPTPLSTLNSKSSQLSQP